VRSGLICSAILVGARLLQAQGSGEPTSLAPEPGETHLRNIRQLTNGGENAEAYFSHDGRRLIFQSTRDGRTCDQQYVMNANGSHVRRVSSGRGKTTCGYFMNGDRRIFFASSQALEKDCPPRPDASKGYVWRLDPFEIYTARADGSEARRLTRFGDSAVGVGLRVHQEPCDLIAVASWVLSAIVQCGPAARVRLTDIPSKRRIAVDKLPYFHQGGRFVFRTLAQ